MAVNLSFELFPGRSLTALYVRDLSNGSQVQEDLKNNTLPIPMALLNPEYVRISSLCPRVSDLILHFPPS